MGMGIFDDKLGTLCMQWLEDKFFLNSWCNCKRIWSWMGDAAYSSACVRSEKINNPHYSYGMAILHATSLLSPVMGSRITYQKLLPMVIYTLEDKVPNIKFNVTKVSHGSCTHGPLKAKSCTFHLCICCYLKSVYICILISNNKLLILKQWKGCSSQDNDKICFKI